MQGSETVDEPLVQPLAALADHEPASAITLAVVVENPSYNDLLTSLTTNCRPLHLGMEPSLLHFMHS